MSGASRDDDKRCLRTAVLEGLGASPAEVQELLIYNDNRFAHDPGLVGVTFPLADEPFVSAWEGYEQEARERGLPEVLKAALVQLNFPIRKGMSEEPAYRAVTRRGEPVERSPLASGLDLNAPDGLRLVLHPTPAGRIPVLMASDRDDFENLVRALTRRNEPADIPASMGAVMVAGYNNWGRIAEHKSRWLETHDGAEWAKEFKRLTASRDLYQDRFIIVSEGSYSGVEAPQLGLGEEEWARLSLRVRLNHECAHYFTKRVLSSMRNNLLDELIADYMGIVAAIGRYRADWFLHFVGLESFPRYRAGGRLENYRGEPPLSDRAFTILQALTKRAAETLERFDSRLGRERDLAATGRLLESLTHLTLEELACEEAITRISSIPNAS